MLTALACAVALPWAVAGENCRKGGTICGGRPTAYAAAKVRRLAPGLFANLIRFHNHFTGGTVTEVLSPQEFYLAQQLCG